MGFFLQAGVVLGASQQEGSLLVEVARSVRVLHLPLTVTHFLYDERD